MYDKDRFAEFSLINWGPINAKKGFKDLESSILIKLFDIFTHAIKDWIDKRRNQIRDEFDSWYASEADIFESDKKSLWWAF